LLILLFDSYTQPLLVLSAIPFSVIGVIWAFFLHSEPLSFETGGTIAVFFLNFVPLHIESPYNFGGTSLLCKKIE
jgi:hypothetical protein